MSTEHVTCARKGRGRPKQFDRDDALDKALDLFWRHGYEATSLAELVEATGAKAPTLYAEFGNKEGLFRAAVERYVTQFAERDASLLADPNRSLPQALGDFFRATAAMFTDKELPSGCFITCTAAAFNGGKEPQADTLSSCHHLQENMLIKFLALRQQRGELENNIDIGALAKFLTCLLQGMSVQARDGTSCADLDQVTDRLIALWPALLQSAG